MDIYQLIDRHIKSIATVIKTVYFLYKCTTCNRETISRETKLTSNYFKGKE